MVKRAAYTSIPPSMSATARPVWATVRPPALDESASQFIPRRAPRARWPPRRGRRSGRGGARAGGRTGRGGRPGPPPPARTGREWNEESRSQSYSQRSPPPTWGGIGWGVDEQSARMTRLPLQAQAHDALEEGAVVDPRLLRRIREVLAVGELGIGVGLEDHHPAVLPQAEVDPRVAREHEVPIDALAERADSPREGLREVLGGAAHDPVLLLVLQAPLEPLDGDLARLLRHPGGRQLPDRKHL